jgi:hypothetical protein
MDYEERARLTRERDAQDATARAEVRREQRQALAEEIRVEVTQ